MEWYTEEKLGHFEEDIGVEIHGGLDPDAFDSKMKTKYGIKDILELIPKFFEKAQISLEDGLRSTYLWYKENN
jgi:hypothetical protein